MKKKKTHMQALHVSVNDGRAWVSAFHLRRNQRNVNWNITFFKSSLTLNRTFLGEQQFSIQVVHHFCYPKSVNSQCYSLHE